MKWLSILLLVFCAGMGKANQICVSVYRTKNIYISALHQTVTDDNYSYFLLAQATKLLNKKYPNDKVAIFFDDSAGTRPFVCDINFGAVVGQYYLWERKKNKVLNLLIKPNALSSSQILHLIDASLGNIALIKASQRLPAKPGNSDTIPFANPLLVQTFIDSKDSITNGIANSIVADSAIWRVDKDALRFYFQNDRYCFFTVRDTNNDKKQIENAIDECFTIKSLFRVQKIPNHGNLVFITPDSFFYIPVSSLTAEGPYSIPKRKFSTWPGDAFFIDKPEETIKIEVNDLFNLDTIFFYPGKRLVVTNIDSIKHGFVSRVVGRFYKSVRQTNDVVARCLTLAGLLLVLLIVYRFVRNRV